MYVCFVSEMKKGGFTQTDKAARVIQKLRKRRGKWLPRELWHSITVRELRHDSNPSRWGTSDQAAELLDGLCGTDLEPGPLILGVGRGGLSRRYFLREKVP